MQKDIHVVGAIIQKNGKILCVQRADSAVNGADWEFPGGKIEPGETPEQALIREVQEEIGCEITVTEAFDHTVYAYEFANVHLTCFLCELVAGEPILHVHQAMKWLSASEMLHLKWSPANLPAVEKLQKKDA
ncbi:(deoxy)nucleoside triphosphate pyrophosphohydrolase [Listeria weihenstephanensis]|uniref:8-oxo-dGTP diphosphatase n=1 Tax=Listeria weihenstephanensis TaxID=1006155 RepID=A0A841Z6F8_9LIST|nr:(deoxy)nucleoside triphosphate pyrophosphohydrolase [Listeria weihenstephanensis]MBC1500875.1 (deoxy)nucleoside triphosphate pyrophosphohydrolase [Listeria weihenstephanensis]